MRTLYFIIGGLLLFAVVALAARALRFNPLRVFVPLWFVVAAVNMYVGVARAGYGFMEELPIFLVLFLVPVAVAFGLRGRWP